MNIRLVTVTLLCSKAQPPSIPQWMDQIGNWFSWISRVRHRPLWCRLVCGQHTLTVLTGPSQPGLGLVTC